MLGEDSKINAVFEMWTTRFKLPMELTSELHYRQGLGILCRTKG